MRKINRKRWTSAPVWIYLALLIGGICLIRYPSTAEKYVQRSKFCENLGFGILGSLVCSFLIDMGSTRRAVRGESYEIAAQKAAICKQWEMINQYFVSIKAHNLPKDLAGRLTYLYSFNFVEGTEIDKNHGKYYRTLISTELRTMKERCEQLEEYLRYHASGKETETLRKEVEKLKQTAQIFIARAAVCEENPRLVQDEEKELMKKVLTSETEKIPAERDYFPQMAKRMQDGINSIAEIDFGKNHQEGIGGSK